MNRIVLATLAVSTLFLGACGGSSSSPTPSITPSPSPTFGPFTASPASSQANPIVVSLTGGPGGSAQTAAVTFSQTGLAVPTVFNIASSTCFGKSAAPADILSLAAGSGGYSNGTESASINLTAKNPGSCSFTTTSPAGNQSVVSYFTVKP